MPRQTKPWTQEADDALRKAVFDGWPLPEMCEKLGRTKAAERARAYILGLSFRLVSPKRRSSRK